MNKIETELRKKLKVKPEKDEDRADYLLRLVQACEAMDADDWDAMSVPAQDWNNAAVKAIQKKRPIVDFEGEEGEDPKPARGTASKDKADEGKATKPKKAGREGMTAMMFIRHYLVANPDATVVECEKALEKKGGWPRMPTKVTISTVRSEFRSVTRIFREQGYFKDGVDVGTF